MLSNPPWFSFFLDTTCAHWQQSVETIWGSENVGWDRESTGGGAPLQLQGVDSIPRNVFVKILHFGSS